MFDYLGVLISVILGLALTHLLLGTSRAIQERGSVKIYWVQLVWALNILIYVLAIWWGMYWWRQLEVWTIQTFFFLTLYACVLFLLAAMLFPHESCAGMDFEANFMRNRRWFFGLQLAAFLLDIPETLAKGVDGLRGVPVEYRLFLPVMIAINIAGLVTANRRVHAALCLVWLPRSPHI
ncbi:MAG: hypothetical protein WDN44_06785 [Sphingomonas sp.]